MIADEIRAEYVEVLARAQRVMDLKPYPRREDGTQRGEWDDMAESSRRMYLDAVAPFVDALAAAGLLPTIVDELETGVWGTERPVRRRVRYLTEWREAAA